MINAPVIVPIFTLYSIKIFTMTIKGIVTLKYSLCIDLFIIVSKAEIDYPEK